MNSKKVDNYPSLLPDRPLYYCFHIDLVCRQFLLDDFHYVICDHNLRSAWRKAKSHLQSYINKIGYKNVVVKRIFFISCDVYDFFGNFVGTFNKVK